MRDWAKLSGIVALLAVVLTLSCLWALDYIPQNSEWTCKPEPNSTQSNSGINGAVICHPTQSKNLNHQAGTVDGNGAGSRFENIKITDVLLAAFTGLLVFVGGFQAYWLWGTVEATSNAARAAKLNAEAVMAAEGAALYPILEEDNLKVVFRPVIWYDKSGKDSDALLTPAVTFHFKNYGKTPAVLISVMYGIDFFPKPSKLRTMHAEDISFIEVIAPDKETRDMTVELLGSSFTRGMAKSVREGPGQLLFFWSSDF